MKVINLIPLFVLMFLFSCKETDKERITRIMLEWQGREVQFPSKMTFTKFGLDTVDYHIPQSEYKILVYVDSLGCTNCKLQLSKWKEFISTLDSVAGGSVPVLFFFQSDNLQEINHITRNNRFDLPVCIDSKGEFNNLNNFSNDPLFQTFLLDKDNRVKVIGNPIHNLNVKDLYLSTITGGAEMLNPVLTTVKIPVTEIDLGNLPENETKEVDFIITNTGNYPLLLKGTTSSCDCTTVKSIRQQVPPKGELKLTIQYKPDQKGDFLRTVSVFINSVNSPIVLTITGSVR